MTELWRKVWDECYERAAARSPEFAPELYYRSGRASKEWPDKEGPDWWAKYGPIYVELWEQWRDQCGLTIAEFPNADGEAIPGIELEAWAYSDDDRNLIVKSVTDRVMVDDVSGDLFIVDLKTGRMTQPWPLQLALNNLCLDYTYGIRARWAGFWSARKGGVEEWFDLSIYPDAWLWEQVWKAREIRDRQLFIPNPNNLCKSACGVRDYCIAMGGKHASFFEGDATLTHNEEVQP